MPSASFTRLSFGAAVVLGMVAVGCGASHAPSKSAPAPVRDVDSAGQPTASAADDSRPRLNSQRDDTETPNRSFTKAVRPFKTIEEADLSLDESEEELQLMLSAMDRAVTNSDSVAVPPKTQSTPTAPPRPTAAPNNSVVKRCALACRSLSSMSRAAERICELAGDENQRCSGARGRVERARTRVLKACTQCPAAG